MTPLPFYAMTYPSIYLLFSISSVFARFSKLNEHNTAGMWLGSLKIELNFTLPS